MHPQILSAICDTDGGNRIYYMRHDDGLEVVESVSGKIRLLVSCRTEWIREAATQYGLDHTSMGSISARGVMDFAKAFDLDGICAWTPEGEIQYDCVPK